MALSALLYFATFLTSGCGASSSQPDAECLVAPDSLRFETVLVGGGQMRSIVVANIGHEPLEAVPRIDSPHFVLVDVDSTAGISIAPGDSLELVVRFAPKSPGHKTGLLSFPGGACSNVSLAGQGETANCLVDPDSLDFGRVMVGEGKDLTVAVVNASDAVLSTHPQTTSADFVLLDAPLGGFRMDPGDTLVLTVSFRPQVARDRPGALVFPEGFCRDVSLVGWGDEIACAVEPPILDFGVVWYRSEPVRAFQIANIGTLTFNGAVESCGYPFVVESGLGSFSLLPGQVHEVRISFVPPRSGEYDCDFVVSPSHCSQLQVRGRATQTWRVLESGLGDAPTIQAGIDSAAIGDTVLVAPGRYVENISFLGKDIVLKSTAGPEQTIIDGSGEENSVVTFEATESRACILEGFTITGGRGTKRYGALAGGGIICANASPTVRGNIIRDNEATRDLPSGAGGGMVVGRGTDPLPAPTIEDNIFRNNRAASVGGGLYVWGTASTTVIRSNTFLRNTTLVGDGAGMYVIQSTTAGTILITHNSFVENTANDKGGGLMVFSQRAGTVDISHNLMLRNTSYGAGSLDNGSGGGIYSHRQVGRISNNTIVFCIGIGESECSGGGMAIRDVTSDLRVSHNIIAHASGCGISCLGVTTPSMGPNLLWNNLDVDVASHSNACPSSIAATTVLADPQFCNPEADDFTLAADSPAFTTELPMGAFSTPGCGEPTGTQPEVTRAGRP